jgi:hypothetical protein
MEHNNLVVSSNESRPQKFVYQKSQNHSPALLTWWYRLTAPPAPPPTASFARREKARRGRVVSLAIPVLTLLLLTLLAQAIIEENFVQIIAALIGMLTCALILFLNRRGFVESAGVLALILIYTGGTVSMLNFPVGLTIDNLPVLGFTVVPDMLALAFFPANILFLIVCISAFQTWAILVYGPHDAAIAHLLQAAPFQTFSRIYVLQLITAITLYVWARSTELAIERADHAEEIAAFEKREKERQKRQLEKKRQLDIGIQQILQTHVDVANGDLNARAPLNKDHILWQVAVALNNLIARLQSQNETERELRQELLKENERATSHHLKVPRPKPDDITHQTNERATSHHLKAQRAKIDDTAHQESVRATGHHPQAPRQI